MLKKWCLLLIIQAILLISCGEDEPTPTAPDTGTFKTFTFSLGDMPYPCTEDGLKQCCIERGYHEATDWLCANTPEGKRVHMVTCWKP